MQSELAQAFRDDGDAPLVFDGRVWERFSRRLGRVGTDLAVHAVEPLGTVVVGRERLVGNGPRRGHPAGVHHLAEVLAPQSVKHGAPELGIAADAVVRVGKELFVAPVEPAFGGAIPELAPDRARAPVLLFLRNKVATLDDENARARLRKLMRDGSAPHAATDDDDVEALGHEPADSEDSTLA